MIECRCMPGLSTTCPRSDHNELLVMVQCSQCRKSNPVGRRKCSCGNMYGTFRSINKTLQGKLAA